MKSAFVPIIKNKTGDTSDKNNYRPIALVTTASYLFEICILEILETPIAQHCTALYCPYLWNDYKKSTFSKIRVAFNNAYRNVVRLPKRSSASTMYSNHNICNFETTLRKNTFGFMQRLEQSTNSINSTLYQSWIVRFEIWNSWIKSLYVT